jgi:hypothetical protein
VDSFPFLSSEYEDAASTVSSNVMNSFLSDVPAGSPLEKFVSQPDAEDVNKRRLEFPSTPSALPWPEPLLEAARNACGNHTDGIPMDQLTSPENVPFHTIRFNSNQVK